MSKNPSEIQRKTEELEYHRNCLRDLTRSRKSREYHLAQVRFLCDELGEEQPPTYNGGK